MNTKLRQLPSVDKVLQALGDSSLPRPMVVTTIRRVLGAMRKTGRAEPWERTLNLIRDELNVLGQSRLQMVINGTGVLIHTNLGRAPLGSVQRATLQEVAGHYTNLEFDLSTGKRGPRAGYLEQALALLCHSQAATVVNNCAAALVLMVRHFTAVNKEVIISRGELIQIGGGFRIPEILESSGAVLREVGTTNKTTLTDYEKAMGPQTGLVLKVHRSNFFMKGFVDSPTMESLAELAKKRRIPLVEDLGSGALWPTDDLAPVDHEPTPAEVLRRGVSLVCFSGDKLMGGPQAGIIAGQAKWVAKLKKEPFFRALRCDKLVLGALQATVDLYLEAMASRQIAGIPVMASLGLSPKDLEKRARALLRKISDLPCQGSMGNASSQVGGGTLPSAEIPSVTLNIKPHHLKPAELSNRLRRGHPSVVGYVAQGHFKLDLRTVFREQDSLLEQCLRQALTRPHP